MVERKILEPIKRDGNALVGKTSTSLRVRKDWQGKKRAMEGWMSLGQYRMGSEHSASCRT